MICCGFNGAIVWKIHNIRRQKFNVLLPYLEFFSIIDTPFNWICFTFLRYTWLSFYHLFELSGSFLKSNILCIYRYFQCLHNKPNRKNKIDGKSSGAAYSLDEQCQFNFNKYYSRCTSVNTLLFSFILITLKMVNNINKTWKEHLYKTVFSISKEKLITKLMELLWDLN